MSDAITASPPSPGPAVAEGTAAPQFWTPVLLLLLLLLLLLSFFLGSFRAFNNDIWMQLAAGRLLAEGKYQFGVDPFSWATAGRYWVNHSWGYAWIVYQLHQSFGPTGLSVVNALVVVALAVVLLRIRPARTSPLISLELIGLTMVAASPRFGLQPLMLSMLLLAVLLFMLFRAGVLGGNESATPRTLWSIPVLFVIWANLDVHFMYGLIVMALCWPGIAFRRAGGDGLNGRTLGLVLLTSVGACCLNPHHVHVFTVPLDLGYLLSSLGLPDAWTGGGAALHSFAQQFGASAQLQAPLSVRYLSNLDAASLTFFPLWLIHAGSWVMLLLQSSKRNEPMPLARLFLGLLFSVLALTQIRMIPWFALVCGPITVLNALDIGRLRRLDPKQSGPPRASFFSRLDLGLALVLFALACVLAWPGWLHTGLFQNDSMRRVGWGIREDQSLRDLARDAAKQEPGNIFNLNLEIAPYCAWYAPKSRTYLDTRFQLFAGDFETFRTIESDLRASGKQWQPFFAKHQVRYLALTDYHKLGWAYNQLNGPFALARPTELVRMMQHLWRDTASWRQIFNDGRSVLVGWHPQHDNDRQPLWDQWDRLAFGPPVKSKRNTDFAPRSLGDLYFQRMTPPRKHSTEAAVLAHQYLFLREQWLDPYRIANLAVSRTLSLEGGGVFAGLFTTVVMPNLFTRAGRPADESDAFDLPALPLLMIRSARPLAPRQPGVFPRALGPNPNKYLALGYSLQSRGIEDAWMNRQSQGRSRLHVLRNIQIAAAAHRALVENPFDEEVHEILASLMNEMGYLDLELKHRGEALKIRRTIESDVRAEFGKEKVPAKYVQETNALAMYVKQLEGNYNEHKRLFDQRAKDLKAGEPQDSLARFQLALRTAEKFRTQDGREITVPSLGLADAGLAGLEKAWDKMGTDVPPALRSLVFQQLFEMYLQLGLIDRAEVFLTKNQKDLKDHIQGGGPEFGFQLICFHAALGEYDQADDFLASLENIAPQDGARRFIVVPLVGVVGQQGLAALGDGGHAQAAFMVLRLQSCVEAANLANLVPEYKIMRGLLALEQGDNDRALTHFEEALAAHWKGLFFPERILAEKYVELLKKQRAGEDTK